MLVADLAQLDMLRSRARGRVTDLVYAAGELTVSEIAEALDQKPTAMDRHLDALVGCGLLIEGEPVRTGKTLARVFAAPAKRIEFPREEASAEERSAVADILDSQLRLAGKEARADIEAPGGSSVRSGSGIGWLTEKERVRVAKLLAEALAIVEGGQRGEGKSLCGVTYALRPVSR